MQVSTAAPATANSIPSSASSSPVRPNGIAASSAALPGISGPTLAGPNSWAELGEDGDGEQRAEAESDDRW